MVDLPGGERRQVQQYFAEGKEWLVYQKMTGYSTWQVPFKK
jgi:hypothetical protein